MTGLFLSACLRAAPARADDVPTLRVPVGVDLTHALAGDDPRFAAATWDDSAWPAAPHGYWGNDPAFGREGVKNLADANIQSVGLFMIGLPGETPEIPRETIEFAVDLDLDFAKFAITVPFPGSKLFEDQWQKTLFRDDWDNYTTFNPDPDRLIYHPDGYDPEELIRMQSWALKRFYMRPRQIWRQMVELRTLSPKVLLYGLYGIAV